MWQAVCSYIRLLSELSLSQTGFQKLMWSSPFCWFQSLTSLWTHTSRVTWLYSVSCPHHRYLLTPPNLLPCPSPLPPSSLPAPATQQTVVLLSWESPLFELTLVLTPVGHQSSFPSGNLSTLKCLPSFCVKIFLGIKPTSFSIAVPLCVCGLRLQVLFHNLSAGRKHTASKKCSRPLRQMIPEK